MKEYTACIAGCGNIGVAFDRNNAHILSHAKGYFLHPHIHLAGVMDADLARAEQAARDYSCSAYDNFTAMMREVHPDIVSVCVPTEAHQDILHDILKFDVKAVIVEKPITYALDAASELVERYEERGIPLFVNYSRRYDRTLQRIKEELSGGKIKVQSVVVKYSKGLLNNGSHAVDLGLFLFGKCAAIHVVSSFFDHSAADPTVSAILHFENGIDTYLVGCNNSYYSIFEVEILHAKGKIVLDEPQLIYSEYLCAESEIFKDYTVLKFDSSYPVNDSMQELIGNVYGCLSSDDEVMCTARSALESQRLCQEVYDRAMKLKDMSKKL